MRIERRMITITYYDNVEELKALPIGAKVYSIYGDTEYIVMTWGGLRHTERVVEMGGCYYEEIYDSKWDEVERNWNIEHGYYKRSEELQEICA